MVGGVALVAEETLAKLGGSESYRKALTAPRSCR